MESTYRNVLVSGIAVLFIWGIFAVAQIRGNQVKIERAVAQARDLGLREGKESARSSDYAVYVLGSVNDSGEETFEPVGGDISIDLGCLGSEVEFRVFDRFDDLHWLESDDQKLKEQLRMSRFYAESFNSEVRSSYRLQVALAVFASNLTDRCWPD